MSHEVGTYGTTYTEFGDGSGGEFYSVVSGIASGEFDNVIEYLLATGRSGVHYRPGHLALLSGDGDALPNQIREITEHFKAVSPEGAQQYFISGSLGGGINSYVQQHSQNPEYGYYAATGVHPAGLVMDNPAFRAGMRIFYKVDPRRAYERNGWTSPDLRSHWDRISLPPESPYTLVLGGLDYIVPIVTATRRFNKWSQSNPDATLHIRPTQGHTGAIRWLANNLPLLMAAEQENFGIVQRPQAVPTTLLVRAPVTL